MKKDFVTLKLAKLAKERGFNEPCIRNVWGYKQEHESFGDSLVSQDNWNITNMRLNTPTYTQLIEWVFENKDVEEPKPNSKINQIEWVEFWYKEIISEICPTCGGCESECSIVQINDPYCFKCNFRNKTNNSALGILNEYVSDWLESNNYKIDSIYGNITQTYKITILTPNNCGYHVVSNNRQEVRHKSFLKSFEILKNNDKN